MSRRPESGRRDRLWSASRQREADAGRDHRQVAGRAVRVEILIPEGGALAQPLVRLGRNSSSAAQAQTGQRSDIASVAPCVDAAVAPTTFEDAVGDTRANRWGFPPLRVDDDAGSEQDAYEGRDAAHTPAPTPTFIGLPRTLLVRVAAAFAGTAILLAAVPAGSSAAVRTGSVQDPRGDASALSGPAPDLQSIAVRYDDSAGTLRVTWTYYDDLRPVIATSNAINGQLGVMAPVGMNWGNVTWSSSSSGGLNPTRVLSSNLSVSGAAGSLTGTTALSDDGHVITTEFSSPLLVGRDWQQSLGMSSGADPYGGFWFDGHGPPTAPPIDPPTTGDTPPATGSGATA